ncbi:recombinase family protein (plasmid) [Deinococcus sp. KNUC1210]|uniref:recombinase family protein n=1 Tax=Deinococcus sp. KNUC1210 TaxID=2917691 RepID=UPI001EEFCE28|nr:recombinase family protein [Deinococcus sp. KNUC1210]ULH17797.1 recombinase family protein [Deinococcus sp. KNUC1210]
MVGAFAEFEREIIRERTRAGLASARLEGRIVGRPHKLSSKQRGKLIRAVRGERDSRAEAAHLWNVHPSTVTRLLMLAEPARAQE